MYIYIYLSVFEYMCLIVCKIYKLKYVYIYIERERERHVYKPLVAIAGPIRSLTAPLWDGSAKPWPIWDHTAMVILPSHMLVAYDIGWIPQLASLQKLPYISWVNPTSSLVDSWYSPRSAASTASTAQHVEPLVGLDLRRRQNVDPAKGWPQALRQEGEDGMHW
jgi:hypothetical protein